MNIVVHRFWDAHDREALIVQPQRVGQRVIAPDRSNGVKVELLQYPQRVRRQVDRFRFGILFYISVPQELRNLRRCHPTGIGARSVQKGTSGPVDRADDERVQLGRVLLAGCFIFRVDLHKGGPAAAQTYHFVAFGHTAIHKRFDARVQTRDVAAAG